MEQNAQSPAASGFPRRFGNYWLDAQLAEGGMSRVMLARLRGPGGFEKKLVVKQILPQLASDPGFVELFVREANTLVRMSHPNIVPVYELGVIDGVYFLAMERVEGATVAELLADGPLGEAMCAHVGAQVCEALRYAHERFGLVHRDVTPRNVIIDAG
ncbi:MAG: serine/threonine-protein kinase, partial [Polyangiales bacterium]